MIIKDLIDLDLTQLSGQTSQPPWQKNDNSYSDLVFIDDNPAVFNVRQNGEYLSFNFSGEVDDKLAILKLREIYDLDFNLDKFYKYLGGHEELHEMSDFCRGLRLFQAKNPFECVISSICSANNSIKRWTKSVIDMKEKWGCSYNSYYSFPDIETLQGSGDELLKCGVGYRAPYIRKACELFTLEIDLTEFYKMSYDEAFEEILRVPGVGPKVADCILLYGFGFRQAFPSDVWIKRIVSYLYFDGADIKVDKIREFGMEEFGDYAGYVQLYMFHYARKSGLMERLK